MAINKNKVVTFNDLENYTGISVTEVPSDLISGKTINHISYPNFRGILCTSVNLSGGNYVFPTDISTKLLKYLYYGYLVLGTDASTTAQQTIYTWPGISGAGYFTAQLKIPTAYDPITQLAYYNNYRGPAANYHITHGNLGDILSYINSSSGDWGIIYHSEIATMDLRNPQIIDTWTSYEPVLDSSTGEPMRDEEGNIVYEEKDSYSEIRGESNDVI